MALNYKEAADCLRDGAANYHTEKYIQAYAMAIDILEALNKLNVEIIVTKDAMGHYTNFEMMQASEEDDEVQEVVDKAPTVEAIPKDQYKAKLKADMVAMLTKLQLEIEELDSRAGYNGYGMPTFSTDYIRKVKVNELIQQKINALKGDEDGNNSGND